MPVSRGTEVEVCSRFRRVWVKGFEVVDVERDGYRLRRKSDHWVLPTLFDAADVRPLRVAAAVPTPVRVANRTRARLR
jgi:hypothetical protein